MVDVEKILFALEVSAMHLLPCELRYPDSYTLTNYIDELKARIAELEAQQRWILITTKESLPKEEGSYLGYIKFPGGEYFQEEVEYSNKYGWMLDESIDITHWMPLPEPPIDQLTAHNATERKDDKEREE